MARCKEHGTQRVNFHAQSAIVRLNVNHGTCSVKVKTRSTQNCTCSVGIQFWYARSESTDMCVTEILYSAFCTTWHTVRNFDNVLSVSGLRTEHTFLLVDTFSLFIRNNACMRHLHCRRMLYCSIFRALFFPPFSAKRSGSRRLKIKVVDQERRDAGWQCVVREKWYKRRSRFERAWLHRSRPSCSLFSLPNEPCRPC